MHLESLKIMQPKKIAKARTKDSLTKKPLISLGNSSRERLNHEANIWVKEAKIEAKKWEKMFTF